MKTMYVAISVLACNTAMAVGPSGTIWDDPLVLRAFQVDAATVAAPDFGNIKPMWSVGMNVHSLCLSRVSGDYYQYEYGSKDDPLHFIMTTGVYVDNPARRSDKPRVEHIVVNVGDVVGTGISHDACCMANPRIDGERVITVDEGREIFFKREQVTPDPRYTLWWLGGYSDDYPTLRAAVEQCAASKDLPEVTEAIIHNMGKVGAVSINCIDAYTPAEIKQAMHKYTEMGIPKPIFGKYCRWLAHSAVENICGDGDEVKPGERCNARLLMAPWDKGDRVLFGTDKGVSFFYTQDVTDDPRQSEHWVRTVDSWVNRMGSGLPLDIHSLWTAVEEAATTQGHPEITEAILVKMAEMGDRNTSRDRSLTSEQIVIAMRRFTNAANSTK